MGPPSLLTLAVALSFFPQLSTTREDDRYRVCSTPYPFNCGSISSVTYPFLAGDRRSFCGHPELKLTCDNNMPAVKIGSEKYQVKNISYPDRLLTLVDTNILEDGCPTKSTDQSIGFHLFELTEGNKPLTLFTGCSRAPTFGNFTVHQVSCLKVDKETNSSYWVFGWYPEMENWLPKSEFSDMIEVSLFGVAVDRLNDDPSSFREVIKEGFEVRWKVEDAWCPDCEASGGVCGYNQSSPGDPACFCPDGSQLRSCFSPVRSRLCHIIPALNPSRLYSQSLGSLLSLSGRPKIIYKSYSNLVSTFTQMYLPAPITVVVAILFFTRVSSSHLDESYKTCEPYQFNCGDIANVSYPFLAGNRSSICGYGHMNLTCEDHFPQIQIESAKYQVENITYQERVFTAVETEYLVTNCPRPSADTNIENSSFEFSHRNEPLYFLLNCQRPVSHPEAHEISCLKNDRSWSYYLFERDKNVWNDTFSRGKCEKKVNVTVLKTGADKLRNNFSSYLEAMKAGFEVKWTMGAGWCTDCVRSHGICGYNPKVPEETTCYCRDQPRFASCPAQGQANSSKRIIWLIVALSAGTSSLIIALVIIFKCPNAALELLRGKWILFWKKNTDISCNVEEFLKKYGTLAPKRYRYNEIKKMTNFFKLKLGEGGYGGVFKGKLPNGREVAVKLLTQSKGNGEEFVNEVASIGRTYHVNIVTLLGFCFEGSKRALVYEFMPNGSLEKFIFSRRLENASPLGWEKLLQISIGIARGLDYLHRGCNMRILHFDIKPHNILLDHDFCPKISDFGLAKLCPNKDSVISMLDTRGTVGYIAPELFCRNLGGVSYKSDVYSYGMMVLEMAGGRHNLDALVDKSSEIYFPHWVYDRIDRNLHLGLQDMVTDEEERNARKMIKVGLWCIQTEPPRRPCMGKVVEMLEGDIDCIEMPPKPFLSSPTSTPQDSSIS